jgi:hypothetical protein
MRNMDIGTLEKLPVRLRAGCRSRKEPLRVLYHGLSNGVFGAFAAAGLKSQYCEEPQAERQMDLNHLLLSQLRMRLFTDGWERRTP